jgi:nucleotide-binding universal stress UspA family protein
MKLILIAFSTTRYSRDLTGQALVEAESLRAAGEEVQLHLLYVLETQKLDEVYRSVGEDAFLGMGPQNEILDTLAQEHHRMARKRIGEAADKARTGGFEVTVVEVEGDFTQRVHAAASSDPFDIIYMTRADRPFISRFLFGSECEKVARLVRGEGVGTVVIK